MSYVSDVFIQLIELCNTCARNTISDAAGIQNDQAVHANVALTMSWDDTMSSTKGALSHYTVCDSV